MDPSRFPLKGSFVKGIQGHIRGYIELYKGLLLKGKRAIKGSIELCWQYFELWDFQWATSMGLA